MSAKDIEERIQIAAFLSTVNEPRQAKTFWEKKGTKQELDAYIRATAEAEREMERVQKKPDKEKPDRTDLEQIKDQPIGKINRRKSSKHFKNKDGDRQKDSHCFRCGEPDWTPDHNKKCKARKARYKRCDKLGYFEKCCKSKEKSSKSTKRDKEKVKKIDSSDTEETASEYTATETETDSSEESINRIKEVTTSKPTRQVEKFTLKTIQSGRTKITRRLNRTGNEFEFKVTLNGHRIVAILDTDSPISILSAKYHSMIKPNRIIKRETSRRFVDVSGRPLNIQKRYKIPTNLNGVTQDIIWWEVDTSTRPIIGMDNFDRLGLQLIQCPNRNNSETVNAINPSSATVETKKSMFGDRRSYKLYRGDRSDLNTSRRD